MVRHAQSAGSFVHVMVGVFIDFLERFANQGPDPDANIGGQTMHQTEARDGFEFVDVELQSKPIMSQRYAKTQLDRTHSGGYEDKVHLKEDENGVKDRIESPQQGVARRIRWNFKESAEFQTVVNDGTQTER